MSMLLCRGDVPTGVASILQLKPGLHEVVKQILILFPALRCSPEAQKNDHVPSNTPIYYVPHTLCINSNTQNSKAIIDFIF